MTFAATRHFPVGANCAPLNLLAGFQGPPFKAGEREGKGRKRRGKEKGNRMDGRKHPQNFVTAFRVG